MFEIGAHIVVKRIGYTHHRIYVGNTQVIEYGGFSEFGKKDKVRMVTLQEFCKGDRPYEYEYGEYLKEKRYSDAEIVQRAKSRLGENKYDLIFNNCEHFANWCTYGDDFSVQASGTVEKNCRTGNFGQAGGLTLLDFVQPFRKLFKK